VKGKLAPFDGLTWRILDGLSAGSSWHCYSCPGDEPLVESPSSRHSWSLRKLRHAGFVFRQESPEFWLAVWGLRLCSAEITDCADLTNVGKQIMNLTAVLLFFRSTTKLSPRRLGHSLVNDALDPLITEVEMRVHETRRA